MTQVEKLKMRIRALEQQIELFDLDTIRGVVKIGIVEQGGKKLWCLAVERDRKVAGKHECVKSWQKIFMSDKREDVIKFAEQLMDDLAAVYERVTQEGDKDDEA